MGRYMADYVKGCDLCNHTKTFPTSPTSKLMPQLSAQLSLASYLSQLITGLPPS